MAEKGSVQIYPSTIEAIRILVTSVAWEEFFVPSLQAMKSEWTARLMDPSESRKKEYPDDYIRGCFATIDLFLNAPKVLIDEADAQKEREEAAREDVESLQRRADIGHVGPLSDNRIDSEKDF